MNIFKKMLTHIWALIDGMTDDNVGAYSAQSAFFVILSFFPLAMLIFSTISYTSISQDTITSLALNFIPASAKNIVTKAINSIYMQSSVALVSVSAVGVIWSASKGMSAIILGLSNIYGTERKWNYFIIRILSMVYTVGLVIVTALTLIILVFGNSILKIIVNRLPNLVDKALLLMTIRPFMIFVVLSIFFTFLYMLVRNKEYSFKDHLPGAVFSSSFWLIFSFAYSYYIDNVAKATHMYGNMAIIIFLMLWIYFCIYSLFIGAELNVYIKSIRY